MKKSVIEKMILEIIAAVDYDIYKSFLPECSEDPDEIPNQLEELVDIVKKYIP